MTVGRSPSTSASQRVDVWRLDAHRAEAAADRVACEAALEVRLGDAPFSVIMRTPGDDPALALGFLFTEGVIAEAGDVLAVTMVDDGAVRVDLAPARAAGLPALLAGRRQVTTTSSCGLCGRQSRESLDVDLPAVRGEWTVPATTVLGLAATLRASQVGFEETGGLHAAGLFDLTGRLDDVAEDVGRHNAVDKLIGRRLRAGQLPAHDRILFVSGRSSFEIVQKAWMAGVPMVGAVSAPSSLAVALAERAGITLLGFVRDGRANVYAHSSRLFVGRTASPHTADQTGPLPAIGPRPVGTAGG